MYGSGRFENLLRIKKAGPVQIGSAFFIACVPRYILRTKRRTQKSRPEGRLSLVQGAKLLSSRCSSRSSRSSVGSGRSGSRSSSSSVGSGRSSSVSSSSRSGFNCWSSFNYWCCCWGFNYWCWCRSFFFFAASSQSNNHQGGDQQGFFHLFSLIISKNKSILLR